MYEIYRVSPLLSAGVVSMRQLELLFYARAYIFAYSHAHIHIYTNNRARTLTYISVLIHPCTRKYTYAHAHPLETARVTEQFPRRWTNWNNGETIRAQMTP